MTNKDLIKQYVGTGTKLPKHQINKLNNSLLATYLRQRFIMLQGVTPEQFGYERVLADAFGDNAFEEYEINLMAKTPEYFEFIKGLKLKTLNHILDDEEYRGEDLNYGMFFTKEERAKLSEKEMKLYADTYIKVHIRRSLGHKEMFKYLDVEDLNDEQRMVYYFPYGVDPDGEYDIWDSYKNVKEEDKGKALRHIVSNTYLSELRPDIWHKLFIEAIHRYEEMDEDISERNSVLGNFFTSYFYGAESIGDDYIKIIRNALGEKMIEYIFTNYEQFTDLPSKADDTIIGKLLKKYHKNFQVDGTYTMEEILDDLFNGGFYPSDKNDDRYIDVDWFEDEIPEWAKEEGATKPNTYFYSDSEMDKTVYDLSKEDVIALTKERAKKIFDIKD